MVVKCEEVWREISNYLEGDIEPNLRIAVDEHDGLPFRDSPLEHGHALAARFDHAIACAVGKQRRDPIRRVHARMWP